MKKPKVKFRKVVFVVFSLCFLSYLCGYPASAQPKQSDYWPTNGWRTSIPEAQGMDSNLLANMLENMTKEAGNVDSVTIVRNGFIVLDVYFHGPKRDTLHEIHSCTKSIMSILIGIAIDQGYISDIHRPVISYFPEKRFANLDERKKAMTLEHVLMMASGLKCQSSWKYGWKGLLKMMRQEDSVQYILDLPMEDYPGTRFEYSNSGSFLLSAIIQKTTGINTLAFARQHLLTLWA